VDRILRALLVIALLPWGCSPDAPAKDGPTSAAGARATAPAPAVVVVVADTLRADHLGCYGYHRSTSPHIDALAATATRYSRAFASSPWTLPSHASLFTGLDPHQHGAQTVLVDGAARERPLADETLTLAESLRDEGFATAGFVANAALLRPNLGVSQGFDRYYIEATTGDQLVPHAIRWLESHRTDPVFLFVNLMDTHKPYNTAPRPGFLDAPAIDDQGKLLDSLYPRILDGTSPLPHREIQQVIDQFDTAITHVDEAVGTLLDALKDQGRFEGATVVVTSDHGEYFGEHHLLEHSKDVYQPALHVPLVLKRPGQSTGSVDDDALGSADTLREILAALPIELSQKTTPRFPSAPEDGLVLAQNLYTRDKDLQNPDWGHRFQRERTTVLRWPHKYIRSSDEQHELYDLSTDPAEAKNLVSTAPDMAADLSRALDSRLRATPPATGTPPPLPKLTYQELEALRALGYVE